MDRPLNYSIKRDHVVLGLSAGQCQLAEFQPDKNHFKLNYRPQTKLRKGYIFTPVCHSVPIGRGGMRGRGHVWWGTCMAEGHA